jgi:hypothetical protein
LWPNSSLSIRLSGSAPQLTATNSPLAARQRVGGPGQHLLAGAAVALDEDRHRRARHLAHPGQVAAVLGDQRGQAGDRLAAALEVDDRRILIAERQALAEHEQRVAELDQIAVGQHRALGRHGR